MKKITIFIYRLLQLDFSASVFAVMENLTPDEVKLLCILPPFLCNYEDVLVKYFGDNSPNAAWDLLHTLLQLQENLKFIIRCRCEEEQSPPMASSSCIKKSTETSNSNFIQEMKETRGQIKSY